MHRHPHTQTYPHREWRGLARVLSEGVRDQTLCCSKGHMGAQLTPILCHEHMRTHTDNHTVHLLCLYAIRILAYPTHSDKSRNGPRALSKTDTREHIVDREIRRLF